MLFFIFQISINFFILWKFKRISEIINLYDYPDNVRKIHKSKTPCIGGLLLFFNLLIFFIYKSNADYLYFTLYFNGNLNFIYFFLSLVGFVILGFVDDKYSISPNKKILLFIIIISLLIYLDEDIAIRKLIFSFSPQIYNLSYWSVPLTTLCFLLFVNAFNMFDGVNLQSGLYSSFVFLIFLIKGVFVELSLAILIFLPFFLFLNLRSKCFLGDNGTLLMSFIISYLFLKTQYKSQFFYADEIFLIMMVPGIDLLRLAISRILKNKNPFSPDKNHIHHLLIARYNYKIAIFILLSITFLPYILFLIFGNFIIAGTINLMLYLFIVFVKKKN